MPLTDVTIRNAKPAEKQQKLFDGGGLHLIITPAGGKRWVLKYRFDGKEKSLAFGTYPEVPLADARRRREEARIKLAAGIDPSETKKAEKRTARLNAANSFEAIAREWHAKYASSWSDVHGDRILRRLEVDAFPYIGGRAMVALKPPEVLDALRRVEKRGALETAHRLKSNIGQVCRYAVATGRAERDVTADLRGALPPTETKHMAAIVDPKQVGELLRAIDGYSGTFPVKCALRLSPMLFQRPGEIRLATWPEFDLDAGHWEITSQRMKRSKKGKQTGGAHIVPLPAQAVSILRELKLLTGNGDYLFPSIRTRERPMSENTINGALRRLGYDGETMTSHGFRATARTIMSERLNVPKEVIEAQLAHALKDPLGRAYDRTVFLEQRQAMMQKWADYLDGLKGAPPALSTPATA